MTTYYTAKDIEEMAAKGIRQLEIGPGITLTDFARETARQLDVKLVAGEKQVSPAAQPAKQSRATSRSGQYNKPAGCMHSPSPQSPAGSQAAGPSRQSAPGASSNTVNRLIDLMSKAIKRGG